MSDGNRSGASRPQERLDSPELLGRDKELAAVADALDQARQGTSAALAIRGGAGIGKSALLERSAATAAGFRVRRTVGVESELELSFAALGDLLASDCGAGPGEKLSHRRAALAGALGLGPPVPGDRFLVAAGALELVIALSEEEPLLIVVDDAQWIDAPSAEVISFVSRRLGADRVALLVACRDDESGPLPMGHLPTLDLSPLSEQQAAVLFDREVGPQPELGFREKALPLAAGNPLAICSFARDAGGLVQNLDSAESLPERLVSGFGRDFDRLDPDERAATILAAVGNVETYAVIEAALSIASVGRSAIERCLTLGIFAVADGCLQFRHPLVRLAIQARCSEAERSWAHRALEEACVTQGLEERAAWHAASVSSLPDEQIACRLEQAAQSARERSTFSAPADLLRRAAELSTTGDDAGRRWLMAAREGLIAGSLGHASADLDRATPLLQGTPEQLDAQELRAMVQAFVGPISSVADLVVPAAVAVADTDPVRASMLLASAVSPLCMTGGVERASALARQALDLVSNAPSEAAMPAKLAMLATASMRGRTDETRVLLDEFLGDPATVANSSPSMPVEAAPWLAAPLMWLGHVDQSREILVDAVQRARETNALGVLPLPLGFLAELELRRGDWIAAVALAGEAVELGESIGAEATVGYPLLTTAAMVAACRGQVQQCTDVVDRALEVSRAMGTTSFESFGLAALTMLSMSDGDWTAAAEQMTVLADEVANSGVTMPTTVPVLLSRAEALHRSGLDAEAAKHSELLSEEAKRTQIPLVLAIAARTRALREPQQAEAHLDEALKWHAQDGDPFEEARTFLIAGELARRARKNIEARVPLRSALLTFRRLEATPWIERATSELRAAGADDPQDRSDLNVVATLTPRELRVALAVAEGGTNREVAATLFISPKTVDYHLGKVFRKLSVRTRTELATTISRLRFEDGAGAEGAPSSGN